jgi:hypothetical protein
MRAAHGLSQELRDDVDKLLRLLDLWHVATLLHDDEP